MAENFPKCIVTLADWPSSSQYRPLTCNIASVTEPLCHTTPPKTSKNPSVGGSAAGPYPPPPPPGKGMFQPLNRRRPLAFGGEIPIRDAPQQD